MVEFKDKIKSRRIELGMTTDELAKKVGVSNATISRWETGVIANQRRDKIELLANALDVKASYLMGLDDETQTVVPFPAADSAEQAHIKKYRALDERGKRVVDAVLDAYADAPVVVKTKEIIMLPSSFAAGAGEPESQVAQMEKYAVPLDSSADFAIRISGDSMEPWLMDGDVALCRAVPPQQGQVAAVFLDGAFLCKQMVRDNFGNFYLFSLNRKRCALDTAVMASGDRAFRVYGTVMIDRKLPPIPTALGEP